MKKERLNEIIIITTTCLFSLIIGILSKDILIGVPLLITGILCSYYASIGKKINFLYAFINFSLIAYTSYKNGLYGTAISYVAINLPMQIVGYITWFKHESNKVVERKIFNFKKSITVITSCITFSILLGFLLSIIPAQQLPFLDSTSCILNIFGLFLFNMRYTEAWWVLLANNITDETIWILKTVKHSKNSIMMLLVSTAYLLINIYGIIKWSKEAKRELQE